MRTARHSLEGSLEGLPYGILSNEQSMAGKFPHVSEARVARFPDPFISVLVLQETTKNPPIE